VILKQLKQWQKQGDETLPGFADFGTWGTQRSVK
jgi:hypothetical protein